MRMHGSWRGLYECISLCLYIHSKNNPPKSVTKMRPVAACARARKPLTFSVNRSRNFWDCRTLFGSCLYLDELSKSHMHRHTGVHRPT